MRGCPPSFAVGVIFDRCSQLCLQVYVCFAPKAGVPLPQFENVRALSTLAQKVRIMAAVSQFPRPRIKQTAEKLFIRSEGWRQPAEFLEFMPRDELKEPISLVLRDVNR
jgi:hypothetical protein